MRIDSDNAHLLRVATVFSSWFDAPLQLVCDCESADDEARETALAELRVLAGGLGVPIEPVLCFESHSDSETGSSSQSVSSSDSEPGFAAGLAAYAHRHAPSIIVADPSAGGAELAATGDQPVFLTGDVERRRMPVGPLAVELTADSDHDGALALAAVLSMAIGEPLRLVVDGQDRAATERATEVEARLRQMGCDVGVDVPESGAGSRLVLVGRTRGATAIVVPAAGLDDDDLLATAMAAGVDVFTAPTADPEAGRASPFTIDLSRPIDRTPGGARLETLDRTECLARLSRHTMARIGYVDAGWPTVVPVNYRVDNGDIFIRSLSGAKLRAAERGDIVCLELDGYDEGLRTGWSVVAHGGLEVIGDPAVLEQAWANDPQPWVASDDWQWLRIVPISVTGREVSPSA
ncbi:MAG: pyridoxamine 5'-phosphate oxidase family protein [Acidimicrobiales bacterium]